MSQPTDARAGTIWTRMGTAEINGDRVQVPPRCFRRELFLWRGVTFWVVSSIRTVAGQAVAASPYAMPAVAAATRCAVQWRAAWPGEEQRSVRGGKGRNAGTRVCLPAHRCTRVTVLCLPGVQCGLAGSRWR